MQRAPVRVLSNLLATAEAVSYEQCIRSGTANSRQQNALSECLGNFVFLLLKAEGPGHAAAA
jgi:hypothetical protein